MIHDRWRVGLVSSCAVEEERIGKNPMASGADAHRDQEEGRPWTAEQLAKVRERFAVTVERADHRHGAVPRRWATCPESALRGLMITELTGLAAR